MPTLADRFLREFVRYTGDGLPDEPIGAPLPIGDPRSGVYNPPKADLRTLFADQAALVGLIDGLIDAMEAAEFYTPETFGCIGDGVADDTADFQAALDSGEHIRLTKGATYLISMDPGLTVPDGTKVTGTGATLRFTTPSGVVALPYRG